jgi:hypothetical protein
MRSKSAVSRPKRGQIPDSARNCCGNYNFWRYIHMIIWVPETWIGRSVAYNSR